MSKDKAESPLCRVSSVRLIKAYYIMFAVSAILSLVMMFVTDGESFRAMLFKNGSGSDNFMDFFNSIRDASSKDVYKNGIIYPPLANMIFFFLSKMISPVLAETEFEQRLLLQRNTTCIFIYMFFVFLCLVAFMQMVKKQLNKAGLPHFSGLMPLFLVFSFPVIYCIQRGNIALLSLACSMFFVFYRNSENKWIRELSFVLLAIAAGIKLYPALFGLLLLTDKQFKRAARLVLYGVVVTVAPFFFYDGFQSMLDVIDNISKFSNDSLQSISPGFVSVDILSYYLYVLFDVDYYVSYNFMVTASYLGANMMFFIMPEEWQKVMCIAFMVMNYTSTGRTYILVLAIIPFVLFLTKGSYRKRDAVYFSFFSILMIVIPTVYYTVIDKNAGVIFRYGYNFFDSPNQLTSAFALHGMMLFMFFDMLVRIAKNEVLRFKPHQKKAAVEQPAE